jgi:hypothetical protein
VQAYLFGFALGLLKQVRDVRLMEAAMGHLELLPAITQASLQQLMADFNQAVRNSGSDPFQNFTRLDLQQDACDRVTVPVPIMYRECCLCIEVHSIFDQYQVATAAYIRTLGVDQGLLEAFICEKEPTQSGACRRARRADKRRADKCRADKCHSLSRRSESQKIEAELLDAAKQIRATASKMMGLSPDVYLTWLSSHTAVSRVEVGIRVDVAYLLTRALKNIVKH